MYGINNILVHSRQVVLEKDYFNRFIFHGG